MLNRVLFWLIVTVTSLYLGWWLSLPVKIDAVHRDGGRSYASVLVRNFPWGDRRRIEWWEKNKTQLQVEYGIPAPDADGTFEIVFWAWNGVYKVDHGTDEDSDLRCFEDMKVAARCIEKSDRPLLVRRLGDGSYVFDIDIEPGGRYYQEKEGGEFKRAD